MIYEFRTYTLHPGALGQFLELFQAALAKREEFSELAAFWYSETGLCNEVVHLWPYESANERKRLRAAAVAAGVWPPDTGSLIQDMRSEIFDAAPSSPLLGPSDNGPLFEMRINTVKPFAVPRMLEKWQREASAGPRPALIGQFVCDVGLLNRCVEIARYPDPDVRGPRVREGEASRPPEEFVVREEYRLMRAAPFSRIR